MKSGSMTRLKVGDYPVWTRWTVIDACADGYAIVSHARFDNPVEQETRVPE